MKSIFLALLALTAVACQNDNSDSADREKYGPIVLNSGGDPNFAAAYAILQNQCISCHNGDHHAVWASYTSDADWVAQGLVIKGNATGSYLIQRIINAGNGSASNMPQGSSALPADQYNTLLTWINNMP
jgi:cytochrome c551/c552